MDRLTSLTTFVQVVDCGGFAAAARRLNMSTTMVSNHIQALEDRLGARLLNRTTRKVSLTEIGTGYYERCTQILAELEAADNIVGAVQSVPRGTLRLYTSSHILRFIGPIVAEYMGLYPDVTVDLTMGERMIDLVEERVDIAIRTVPTPESSLITRKLIAWRHILCATPEYLQQHGPITKLAQLADHNCLRYALYPFGDDWHFTGPDGASAIQKISGNLVTNSAEVLRIAALEGRGLLLGPDFYIFEDIAAKRLVPVLPTYRPVEFSLHAIYPNRQYLAAKARSFLDLVAARIASHWSVIEQTMRQAGA
jgi:DNA-binding transcriptional LysR family regulator